MRPRLFSRRLDPAQRRVYLAATIWFVLVSAAMVWPAYALLARVRPFVLGIPFGLAWLALMMAASFGVALALFRWEIRAGLIDAPVDGPDDPASLPAADGTR